MGRLLFGEAISLPGPIRSTGASNNGHPMASLCGTHRAFTIRLSFRPSADLSKPCVSTPRSPARRRAAKW